MLTEIRDRSTGVFAWFIAAIIIIPMAFFGVQQYASTDARPTVVQIGERKITQQEYQARLLQEQNRARSSNPSLANSDLLNSEFYKKQVLQTMVDRSLTDYIAIENNYQIGEAQVDQTIRGLPNFQTDGKFDPELFKIIAASRGRGGAKQIKDDIRTSTRAQQVVSGYQESALVLPNEVRELLEIQSEERTFDLLVVKQSDYNDKVAVTDAEIAEFYQTNIQDYQLPDRVSINYIELDRAKIAENAVIEDSAIQVAYDDYKQSFITDETRNTRHILLGTGDDKDEAAQLTKANELVQQLKDGADFAELAKANSDDPGSAANGGSLGDVERGQMVPEFDEATFGLELGAISAPIKTQFGYHIIQVEKIDATQPDSFEDLRFELEQEERDRIADEQVLDQSEQLKNILFEQSDNLEAAATELNLEVKSTELFSRDAGAGIAVNEAVRAAAFDPAVLEEGLNSDLIEISDGQYVALRKFSFDAAKPKKLEVVAEEIKANMTRARAIAAAKDAGDSLLARAEQSWAELAGDDSVVIESHTVTMIDTDRKVASDVLSEVVKMRLNNGTPVVNSFTGVNGDFNIVRLNTVAAGDLSAVSQQVKDATRSLIELRNGSSLFGAYISGLNEELDIEVNQDLL